MKSINAVELLAPVGSFEALNTVINAGCDAIYFGITQFNMRSSSAKNFKINDISHIVSIAHKNNVKAYLTLNTLLYDNELEEMKNIIDEAKKSNVDATIVSDMAAAHYAFQKGVEVHISTQLSLSNIEAIKFYSQLADRFVLARELSIDMIKHIIDKIKVENITGPSGKLIEIEAFVHGAMCVSISGRCGMSLYTSNNSANRGMCRQNCRREFTVKDDHGKVLKLDNNFIMSPEDLCTIDFTDELINIGVKSLKIEGRGRAPEYGDTVVRCYREAIDSVVENTFSEKKINNWHKRLKKVFNKGLGTGFYLGKPMNQWSGIYGSKATEEKSYIGCVKKYYPKIQVAEFTVLADKIVENEKCLIIGDQTGVYTGKFNNMRVNEKTKRYAIKGDEVTMKVSDTVRKNDKVYVVRQASRT